ncbi:hypothetical protein BC828DRAFT_401051 [Blastocladiella britannica]|nr:hypothetical protein BC828DRAFT_401051 [Blastocladiella britannica]
MFRLFLCSLVSRSAVTFSPFVRSHLSVFSASDLLSRPHLPLRRDFLFSSWSAIPYAFHGGNASRARTTSKDINSTTSFMLSLACDHLPCRASLHALQPTRFHNGARCSCGVDDTTWHWLGCTLARDDRDAALIAARADMAAYLPSLLPAPASRTVPTPAPPPAPAPLLPPIVALARRLTDLVCIRRLAAGLVRSSDVAMVRDALVDLFADGRPPPAVRITGHLVHALATRLRTMVHRPHINRLQRRDFDEDHAENPEAPPAKGLRFEKNRATGRPTGDSYPSRPLPILQRTVLPIRHGALFCPGASPGGCR